MVRFGKLAAALSATLALAAAGSAGATTWLALEAGPSSLNRTLDAAVQSDGQGLQPATWALMILGFGLAGATLRRQRAL